MYEVGRRRSERVSLVIGNREKKTKKKNQKIKSQRKKDQKIKNMKIKTKILYFFILRHILLDISFNF